MDDKWQKRVLPFSWDILPSRTFLSDHRSLVISTQWTLLVLELVHSQIVAITHLTQGSDAVVDVALGLLCAGRCVLRCWRLRIVSRTQRRWFGVAADLNERAGKGKQHERDCHKDSYRNQTTMSQLLTHCHYSCSCRFRPLSVGACGVDSRRERFCHRSSLALWLGRSWWCSRSPASSPRRASSWSLSMIAVDPPTRRCATSTRTRTVHAACQTSSCAFEALAGSLRRSEMSIRLSFVENRCRDRAICSSCWMIVDDSVAKLSALSAAASAVFALA